MDYLFSMGFNRRSFVPGLLVVLASCSFAEFTANDSNNLGSLQVNVNDIKGDVSAIKTTVQSQQLQAYSFFNEVKPTLNTINSTLSTANSHLSTISSRLLSLHTVISTIKDDVSAVKLTLNTVESNQDTANSHLSTISSTLSNIESSIDDFNTDFNNKFHFTSSHRLLVEASLDTTAKQYITSLLYPLQSIDGKLVLTSYNSDSSDCLKVHDPATDDILLSLDSFSSVVTNHFSQDPSQSILSALGEIASGISNFVNQAPGAYSPAFLTNYYASTLPFFYPQLNQNALKKLFQLYFGHSPSSSELADFTSAYRFTAYLPGLEDYFLNISPDSLPPGSIYSSLISSYRTTLNALGVLDNQPLNNAQKFARDRYYQYGTRPLIQFFESATNDYPLASKSVITQVQTPDGPKPGFSSGFVDTVTSLASSFQIETNVPSVSTQEIVNIENSFISGQWDQTKNETPDNYALSDLSITLQSSLQADSSTVLNIFNESGTDALDFQFPVSIGSSQYQLNYSIPATAPIYRPYVAFFAAIVKGIIVMYFGLQIWERVVKEVWMGRRF